MDLIDEEFADWLETLEVRTLTGEGAWGPVFAQPVDVQGHWQFENRVVVAADGSSVTSNTQVQCGARWRPQFTAGSHVKLPGDDYEYTVISVRTWPGSDSHLEVALN